MKNIFTLASRLLRLLPAFGLQTWAAGLLVILGLGVRFIDFADPPLDEGYRNLNSLIVARGIYYQLLPPDSSPMRQAAIDMWKASDVFEPQFMETLVALVYWITGAENVLVPRFLMIFIWGAGGIGLFLLARRMVNSNGALGSMAFFFFLPMGIFISRRFQTDPLMVTLMIYAILALDTWGERKTMKSALAAGFLCGITVLVKMFAVFFIACAAVAIVLSRVGWKNAWRSRQVWVMGLVMIAVPAVYYIFTRGGSSLGYFVFWNVGFANLLLEPWFYVRWLDLVEHHFGLWIGLLGFTSCLFLQSHHRSLMLGLWFGYLLFGLAFPWQIHTHDYYSLSLIPILGLSLAPVIAWLVDQINPHKVFWKLLAVGVIVLALGYPAWHARLGFATRDSAINWNAWLKIGQALPVQGKMIALTEDYGTRLRYFAYRSIDLWPSTFDFDLELARNNSRGDFEALFQQKIADKDYFLITNFSQLEMQPDLRSRLAENYPVFQQGDGYIIYLLSEK